ncbi:alcohol dehydrogenase [Capronia epimyces CBS 606.96]|uniref:D-xylose reductase [NAD(P)H] n=1 Tax=Capronia epimyces CBS 606.96 TaxID=1182542 RepID=W9YBA6_9EURO|nr:alcohol dehydrogenase [Capronia epimyces CBS 606.96]EXJ86910.1 alcohol dehydrogenase [Capronia epimyces CBS 606.96]
MNNLNFKLNSGFSIPALGLGTWQSPAGQVRAAVSHAIKCGYRHIDCAYVYGNEQEVGEGIKDGMAAAGIARSELFVTTKLWCTYHTRAEQNLDLSLKLLDLEYVDLYLMHWPVAMNPNGNHEKFPRLADGSRDIMTERSHINTYKDMENLLSTGKVKSIGVCNYSKRFLKELLPYVEVVPAVNQIENHPLLPQEEIIEFCRLKGIHITAYSPLGSSGSPLMKDSRILKLAEEKQTNVGTILLSYHIARGSSVLAKSVTPSRIEENMHIITLSDADLTVLAEVARGGVQRFVYPEFGVDFGFPDKRPAAL